MWILLLHACRLGPPAPAPPDEGPALVQLATQALDAGRLEDAAEAVALGLAVAPAAFAPVEARLLSALDQADPGLAAPAYATLYEGALDPGTRQARRDAALAAAAQARYAPDQRERTQAEHVGVTRAMALDALRALQAGYVDPLPDARLLQAAARRLEALTGAPAPPPPGPLDAGMAALWDLARARELPEPTAVAELTEGAFAGADPWSAPIWPAQVAAWRDRHDGVSPGRIGLTYDAVDGAAVVRELAEGGAAWTAGVHVGDRLLAVNGLTVDAHTATEALRGPDGSALTLEVMRDGTQRSFELVRAPLAARTAAGWQRQGQGFDPFVAPRIGLLRVAAFRPHTDAEITQLLPDPEALDGLILDLRANRGGDLDPALALVDRFVAEGAVIGVEGRVIPEGLQAPTASPGDPWEGLPVVVLVDRETASSAEVVAGALQQLAGAVVLGERTAGKGTSQILRTDPSWSYALQYTNLVWTLPDGRRLHRDDAATVWGVQPTLRQVPGHATRAQAAALRAQREALQVHADGSPMRPQPPVAPDADPAIAAAVEQLARRDATFRAPKSE